MSLFALYKKNIFLSGSSGSSRGGKNVENVEFRCIHANFRQFFNVENL